jgi:hypothetical protein
MPTALEQPAPTFDDVWRMFQALGVDVHELPAFRNHRALGAVAAMVMSDSVKDYAHSQGLYVLVQNGESEGRPGFGWNPTFFTPSCCFN